MKNYILLTVIFLLVSFSALANESVDFGTNMSMSISGEATNIAADNAEQDGVYDIVVTLSLDALATESVFFAKNASATELSTELAAGDTTTVTMTYGDYVSMITLTETVELDVTVAQVNALGAFSKSITFFGENVVVLASSSEELHALVVYEDGDGDKELFVKKNAVSDVDDGTSLTDGGALSYRIEDTDYLSVHASETVDFSVRVVMFEEVESDEESVDFGSNLSMIAGTKASNISADNSEQEGAYNIVATISLDATASGSVFFAKNASATVESDEVLPGESAGSTLEYGDYISVLAATHPVGLSVKSSEINVLGELEKDITFFGDAIKILASNTAGFRFTVVHEDATPTKELFVRENAVASVGTGTSLVGDGSLAYRMNDAQYLSVFASESVALSIKVFTKDYTLSNFVDDLCYIDASEIYTKVTNNSTDSVVLRFPASGYEESFDGNFYFKMNATDSLSAEPLVGSKGYGSRILMPNEYVSFLTDSVSQPTLMSMAPFGNTFVSTLRKEIFASANETPKTISFSNAQSKKLRLQVLGNGKIHYSIGGTASTTSALTVASSSEKILFIPFGKSVSIVASEPVRFRAHTFLTTPTVETGGNIQHNHLLK